MRRFINFNRGHVVQIEGRDHVFERCAPSHSGSFDEPDDYQFLDQKTHRILNLTQQKLDNLYNKGLIRIVREYEKPSDRLPDEDTPDVWKRRLRQHYLKAFDAAPVPLSDKKLKSFVAQTKTALPIPYDWTPSAGTMRRWIKERGESGDRRLRFMGDRYPTEAHRSKLHPTAQEVIAAKAEAYWMNRRVTATDVWNEVVAHIARQNQNSPVTQIPRPSYATVWRYLKKHMNFDRACSRDGFRAAQRLYQPIRGSLKPEKILDVAQFDHTTLDCWVLDDRTGIPVGRPHLGVMIDVHSRYPLAYYLSFTPPSLLSVHACLRRAVRTKDWIKQQFPEINGEWVAYGIPRTIVVDNAWESTGSSFVDACEDAGISIDWAPVRTPEYKGGIERFFGTLNKQLIHKLQGSVPFKPRQMAELGIDPEAETILFLSDLEELICQYVIEVYGRDIHSALKASPEQAWRKCEKIKGIDIANDLASLDASFGTFARDKTLSREGIKHNGLTYCSEDVHQLLVDLLPLEKKRNRVTGTAKVKIKYYPEDITRISIWNEASKNYVDLPCTESKYTTGMTEYHHKVLTEWAKQQDQEFQTEEQRCLAKSRLAERISALVPQRIRDRRRLQRLKPQIQPVSNVVMRTVDALENVGSNQRPANVIPIATVSNRNDGRVVEKTPPKGRRSARRGQPPKALYVAPSAPTIMPTTEAPSEEPDIISQIRKARLERAHT